MKVAYSLNTIVMTSFIEYWFVIDSNFLIVPDEIMPIIISCIVTKFTLPFQ